MWFWLATTNNNSTILENVLYEHFIICKAFGGVNVEFLFDEF